MKWKSNIFLQNFQETSLDGSPPPNSCSDFSEESNNEDPTEEDDDNDEEEDNLEFQVKIFFLKFLA